MKNTDFTRFWNADRDNLLRENYKNVTKLQEIFPAKSMSAIKQRVIKLGLVPLPRLDKALALSLCLFHSYKAYLDEHLSACQPISVHFMTFDRMNYGGINKTN
jgi:hypothetical protein